jgi:hypothetical protein
VREEGGEGRRKKGGREGKGRGRGKGGVEGLVPLEPVGFGSIPLVDDGA